MKKSKRQFSGKRRDEINEEAFMSAISGASLANYPTIFEGFMAKGIPEDQIIPRVNIFTYRAWLRIGRQVKKGEHGVKVATMILVGKDGEEKRKMPWNTTVFHVSQTEPFEAKGKDSYDMENPSPQESEKADAANTGQIYGGLN